jgi:hypothetical protein
MKIGLFTSSLGHLARMVGNTLFTMKSLITYLVIEVIGLITCSPRRRFWLLLTACSYVLGKHNHVLNDFLYEYGGSTQFFFLKFCRELHHTLLRPTIPNLSPLSHHGRGAGRRRGRPGWVVASVSAVTTPDEVQDQLIQFYIVLAVPSPSPDTTRRTS